MEPPLPPLKKRGRPGSTAPRDLNAVFYVLKSGCQRRILPREFPPRKTVFHYFRIWHTDGTRERMNRTMRRRLREQLGVEVEVVNRFPTPPPEKASRIWAREWFKEGREMDLGKLPKRPAFENLPRRWVAERTFAWIFHNRSMSEDHERLCSTGEAVIHAAMTRLMVFSRRGRFGRR